MNHENNVKTFFNESAQKKQGYYDAPNSFAYKAQKWARHELLNMIKQAPKTILDAGSGRGDLSLELAQKFPKSKITGVDFAEEMIKKASRKITNQSNISFQKADLTHLPFTDGQFVLTICLNTLHLIPKEKMSRALSELARVTSHTLLLEIKNKNNIYTFLKKIKERLHPKGALTNFTTPGEIKNILTQHNFKLKKKSNIFLLSLLSPIIILKFNFVGRWAPRAYH